MTDTAGAKKREDVNMAQVNKGRYFFIGTMRHGDDVVAVIADTTLRSPAQIAGDQNALKSRNRMAFAAAAATIGAPNVSGTGIAYLRSDELEKRKAELSGADKETFKQAGNRIADRKEELATAPLPGHTRTLSAVRIGQ